MDFPEIQALVERALEDKELTRAEMDEIVAAITADGEVSTEEAQLMEQIREMVLRREIRVVD
ncbi:MAG: hypothetical protein NW237_16095 [Cyanobacteriota bacterium]|nr:hypothetical protein [Cyanobacteriota bacterium]